MPEQKPDFALVMARNSDLELAEVFVHSDNYIPEAIAAAQAELLKRGVTLSELTRKRNEAVRAEVSRVKIVDAQSKKKSILIALAIIICCAMAAATLEALEKTPSLPSFTSKLMEIGFSVAMFGFLLVILMFKFVLRVIKMSAFSDPNHLSLETMRHEQDRHQASRSILYMALSVLGGGLIVGVIGFALSRG